MSAVRRAGSAIAFGVGLFWAVWWFYLLFTSDTGDSDYSSSDLSPDPSGVLALAFFLMPCLACMLGGWYSWQGRRGWRWPPIVVCAVYALLFSTADDHTLAWTAVVTSNALVVLLLLFSRRSVRGRIHA